MTPSRQDDQLTPMFGDEDDDICWNCGGEGFIAAADGDGSDWGEDTYSGPMDAVIKCRHCNSGRTTP